MMKISAKRCFILVFLGLALALLSACSQGGNWTGIVVNEVVINAPPQQVFAYLENYKNQFEWSKGVKELDCQGSGLNTFCTGKTEAFGQIYEGTFVMTEYIRNQKTSGITMTNNGDIAIAGTTLYLPHPKGTRLVQIMDISSFKLPPVLASLSHETVQKKIKESMEENAERLKAAIEKM